MKINILLASLACAALAVSCTKDDNTDDILRQERETFETRSAVGIYPRGESSFEFDKSIHQIYLNPSAKVVSIQDDEAAEYMQITLGDTPVQGAVVDLATDNNMGITDLQAEDAEVIKVSGEKCWLWSDSEHAGVIIIWI